LIAPCVLDLEIEPLRETLSPIVVLEEEVVFKVGYFDSSSQVSTFEATFELES